MGDSDLFSFTGLAGDVMVVQATALASGDDICVAVFDPGAARIANECAVQSARADVKLPSSGTYVIRVSDLNSDETPAYAILLDRVSPPSSTTTPVEFNRIVAGAIEPLGDADQYSAVGAAGDLFIVQATGQSPGDDLCVELFGPTGTLPSVVLVAHEPHGRIVGFIEVGLRSHADGCDPSFPVGYVEGWYVVPGCRGRKVGARLMAEAEEWARNRGCQEMASDTWLDNLDSQRAHEALGFEVVDRCVTYRKPL